MIRFLIKSGQKSIYLVILGVCFFLMLWQHFQQQVDTRYDEMAEDFFEQEGALTYEELEVLKREAGQVMMDIYSWTGYPEPILMDEIEMKYYGTMSGKITYDMILWKLEQLNQPGRWTETVREDNSLMSALSNHMESQYSWQDFADNRMELLSRNARRYRNDAFRANAFADMTKHYNVVYQDLEEACSDQTKLVYPEGVEKFLTQLRNDFGHLVILLLVSFPVFVTFLKEGIGAQSLISRMGIREAIRKQYISHMVWSFLLYAGYMLLFVLPWREQVFRSEWLEKPVQILTGYEYFPYPITIAGFILLLMALKCVMAMATVALILGISFVSKNNIAAMAAGGILVSGMMAAGVLEWPMAVFAGLPYFPLFSYPVPKSLVLAVGSVLVVLLIGWLLPMCGKRRMLRIYSGK